MGGYPVWPPVPKPNQSWVWFLGTGIGTGFQMDPVLEPELNLDLVLEPEQEIFQDDFFGEKRVKNWG